MKIIHHFGLKVSSTADARLFAELGIHLDLGSESVPGFGVTGFEISEDDPNWTDVHRLAQDYKITEFVKTEFAEHENRSASVLCMLASLQKGFPSDGNFLEFLGKTYDLANYCLHCGAGGVQANPFRIKSVRDLKRTVWQLNWLFDEFLVARETWTSVFKPFGVECLPVLFDQTGDEVGSVVQLQIAHETDLAPGDLVAVECLHCGRKKSPLSLRGFSPSPVAIPAPLFKSTNLFGTGANAFRRVFVSSELFSEIQRWGLRGIDFYPCSPSRTVH